MNLTAKQKAWFDNMRREWAEIMKPFDELSPSPLFPPVPHLDDKHMLHAQLIPDREFLLTDCLPKNSVVAEVGTQEGYFARKIFDNSMPREFHIIDIDLSHFRKKALIAETEQIIAHEGDSSTILAEFPDASFDWIYIDADHSYEGVRKDIEVAKNKVRESGMLVFNDYIYWSHLECYPYGVAQAVNELCINENWEIIYLALHPLFYNDVVIRKCGVVE